ncbi:MAG: RNA polymerase sigma factor [Acidimicrobiia bacterium]
MEDLHTFVLRAARQQARTDHDAEEIASDVMAQLLSKWPATDYRRTTTAVTTLVRYRALDFYRRAGQEAAVPQELAIVSRPSAIDPAEFELVDLLRDLIDRIPERCDREASWMKLQGATNDYIAEHVLGPRGRRLTPQRWSQRLTPIFERFRSELRHCS